MKTLIINKTCSIWNDVGENTHTYIGDTFENLKRIISGDNDVIRVFTTGGITIHCFNQNRGAQLKEIITIDEVLEDYENFDD
jgi:hypothetical protein